MKEDIRYHSPDCRGNPGIAQFCPMGTNKAGCAGIPSFDAMPDWNGKQVSVVNGRKTSCS
ncbi:hypothetical protein [Flavobacterium sp.]